MWINCRKHDEVEAKFTMLWWERHTAINHSRHIWKIRQYSAKPKRNVKCKFYALSAIICRCWKLLLLKRSIQIFLIFTADSHCDKAKDGNSAFVLNFTAAKTNLWPLSIASNLLPKKSAELIRCCIYCIKTWTQTHRSSAPPLLPMYNGSLPTNISEKQAVSACDLRNL